MDKINKILEESLKKIKEETFKTEIPKFEIKEVKSDV